MPSFSGKELDVLSTLAYYQALGVPSLTTMEILRYWTPWPSLRQDFGEAKQKKSPDADIPAPSFYQAMRCIDALTQKGVVQIKNGYVALFGEPDFFHRRIEAKKQGVKKRRICLRFTRFVPYIPFVRMLALTGSLAVDNADEQSDIDILVGSANGRIWTTRILITILFQLLGKRRHGNKVKNRICLNHYLALNPLSRNEAAQPSFRLVPEALTTAHIYAQAIPLWGKDIFHATQTANPWLYSHIALPFAPSLPASRYAPSPVGLNVKGLLEKYLSPFWNLVEKNGGSLQKKHIARKLAGKPVDPLEVLVEENTLLFHYPFSRSKYALTRYRQRMQSLLG